MEINPFFLHYLKVFKNGNINKKNFNKYVEKVMNDNDFINSNFDKLIKSV